MEDDITEEIKTSIFPLPPWEPVTYVKSILLPCLYTTKGIKPHCADKSLARPGRKQANVSVRMVWISFGTLPCRRKKKLDDSSRPDVVEIARPWHASKLLSFLVELRTHQHPGTWEVRLVNLVIAAYAWWPGYSTSTLVRLSSAYVWKDKSVPCNASPLGLKHLWQLTVKDPTLQRNCYK